MKYSELKNKSNTIFRRIVGVKKTTFELMSSILDEQYRLEHTLGGAPSKLCLEDKLLMTLCYWREYRTYLHIGTEYGYSESQAYKIIRWTEDTLIKSNKFHIPGKKKLYELDKAAIVLIDVTESPVERPQKKAAEVLFR